MSSDAECMHAPVRNGTDISVDCFVYSPRLVCGVWKPRSINSNHVCAIDFGRLPIQPHSKFAGCHPANTVADTLTFRKATSCRKFTKVVKGQINVFYVSTINNGTNQEYYSPERQRENECTVVLHSSLRATTAVYSTTLCADKGKRQADTECAHTFLLHSSTVVASVKSRSKFHSFFNTAKNRVKYA